ncbi:MAG: TPM domain-containing protein [Clostridia bacterium]|nr:TPM domain-containing protein [Clostridia bacterium]
MKKIISLLLAVFLFASFSALAFAYESKVEDNADLFTYEEFEQITSDAADFTASKDISLAVLTIDYAQGLSSEEYANDYIDNLIDSEGWNEDCMLFMIDMDNRNVWVSTTGRAENIYYDVDSVIDGGYDYLVNGEYGQCILGMIETARNESYFYDGEEEIVEEHYIYFPEDVFEDEWYNEGNTDFDVQRSVSITDILIYIIVGLGAGGISVFAVKNRYKNFGKGDEFDTDDVFLNLTGSNDTVISRNVITTKIPRNNNHHRSGGGFSGGARPSGGGRSHGGGGRGF